MEGRVGEDEEGEKGEDAEDGHRQGGTTRELACAMEVCNEGSAYVPFRSFSQLFRQYALAKLFRRRRLVKSFLSPYHPSSSF